MPGKDNCRAASIAITMLVLLAAIPNFALAQNLVLFEDDFDDGPSPAWSISDPDCANPDGEWMAAEGEFCAIIEGFTAEDCTAQLAGEEWWSNYSLSFDVTMIDGTDRIAGINWANRSSKLTINLNTYLGEIVLVTGGPSHIIWRLPYDLEAGVKYHVRFGIFGTIAGVEVDGVHLGTVDVGPYFANGEIATQGKIALLGFGGGAVGFNHVCFDNVKVEILDSVAVDDVSWGTLKANFQHD